MCLCTGTWKWHPDIFVWESVISSHNMLLLRAFCPMFHAILSLFLVLHTLSPSASHFKSSLHHTVNLFPKKFSNLRITSDHLSFHVIWIYFFINFCPCKVCAKILSMSILSFLMLHLRTFSHSSFK